MILSDRMKAVVGLVKPCECIADIGCDHGYVAIELIRRGLCKSVIAMDINAGPLERARANIETCGMHGSIQTRQSDGTRALLKGEADGIICAGMGGRLVISILENGRGLVRVMEQLILQPQSEISEVRAYLRENSFVIEQEDIVCEDGKYYPMMRVTNGRTDEQSDGLLRVYDTYGKYLLENAHPILEKYLFRQRDKLKSIKTGLVAQEQTTQRQQHRISELEQELGDIAFCLDNYF